MNTINNNDQDLQKVNDAELEKRIENKCEAWGNSIDQKVNAFEKKMPRPVNSFLDALCVSVLLVVAAWVFQKLSWISSMPSGTMLGLIFCALFVISLIYRMLIKPKINREY